MRLAGTLSHFSLALACRRGYVFRCSEEGIFST
jgi:hypothetical protein